MIVSMQRIGAALGAHAKLWAALATGVITFLMIYAPQAVWAHAAALAVNAVLVYLVPNWQPPQQPPGAAQRPPGA